MTIRTMLLALFLCAAAAAPASAADRVIHLHFKSKPATNVQHDMDSNGAMGAGDMIMYRPVPLYTLKGKRVGERAVTTSISTDPDATGMSMAESQVDLYFGHGNALYETIYAPGYFNGQTPPIKKGQVWRRAIIGGTGKYMGARGEDVVTFRDGWVYFDITVHLP